MQNFLEFFFHKAQKACFFIDASGVVVESNAKAVSIGICHGVSIGKWISLNDIKDIFLKKKEILVSFSGFPAAHERCRWRVEVLPDESFLCFFQEEVSVLSSEDFLLHLGLMRSVLDCDPHLIWVVNHAGQCLFANRAVLDYAGVSHLTFLDQKISKGDIWLPFWEEEGGGVKTSVDLMVNSRGEEQWFETRRFPWLTPQGEELILLISHNITPWKLLEQGAFLEHQKFSLLLKNAYLTDLLLSNLEKKNQSQVVQKLLTKIDLILKEQILGEKQTIDLDVTIQTVYLLMKDSFDLFGIDFVVQKPQGCPPLLLRGTPVDCLQVLMILIQNAMDAINLQKGLVKGRIELSVVLENELVKLRLSDNGVGIGDNQRASLFDPLVSEKALKPFGGIGLSLAQKLLRNFGGSLVLESEKDAPTTFLLTYQIVCAK